VTVKLGLFKPGIDCPRLPRAAVLARQTLSFVYALIILFVSSIETRQPRVAVDRFSILAQKKHPNVTRPSQLKSFCHETKNHSDLALHARSSRAATWYRLCEAKQRTLPRAATARNRYPALEEQISADWKERCGSCSMHLVILYGTRKEVTKCDCSWEWGSWAKKYTNGRKIGRNIYAACHQTELPSNFV
jgi:hypothetical protein